ncbi:MAG TPA: hypothetical protein VJH91_03660 [Candidatus Paceibacterota bacterium]
MAPRMLKHLGTNEPKPQSRQHLVDKGSKQMFPFVEGGSRFTLEGPSGDVCDQQRDDEIARRRRQRKLQLADHSR